jgi:ubiquinone/menaquinone biosynthesis C-methylase UbiE
MTNRVEEKRHYFVNIEKWRRKNSYYHDYIKRFMKFIILENSSILELSCRDGDLLAALNPEYGVGVDNHPELIEIARKKYPSRNLKFICADIEKDKIDEDKTFDYIILNGTMGEVKDVQKLLQRIAAFCNSDTRIVIIQYNPLWEPILKIGEKLRLKMPEGIKNWLSMEDIDNFLQITGYQTISRRFLILFPKKLLFIGPLFNKFISQLPAIKRLNLVQILVARYLIPPADSDNKTCSVVITCRDEKDNIEPLVQRIPQLGKHTEIIFVEGHSVDGTREEIKRVIEKYSTKDIKLLIQDGIGQEDAFRKGFDHASGDFIIWLEADLTTPPEEIARLWDVYKSGRGEFINGTRLVYRMEKGSMPLINLIGNRIFGNVFTILLGQRFTDTLCGIKGISRRNYINIRKNLKFFGDFDPFGDFELIFGAIKNNLKVSEVPVSYHPRKYGRTKTKPFKHGWLLIKMCWIAFKKFKLI